MSRKKHIFQLVFYLIGVYASFLIFSVFQEKIFKKQYTNRTDGTTSKFIYSQAVAIFPALSCYIIGRIRRKVLKQGQSKIPKKQKFILGGLYYLMQYTIGTALVYISYPTQLIFTNLKLLTIYVVQTFYSRVPQRVKKIENSRIYIGCFITAGIFLYSYENIKKSSQNDYVIGIVLLITSLVSEGFLVDSQTFVKQMYRPSSNDLFTQTNKISFVSALIVCMIVGQLRPILQFIQKYQGFGADLLCLSIFGTLGQICVYELIKRFRPSIYALFTVFRKVLTITISILVYKHETKLIQIVGIVMVFNGLFYELHGQLKVRKIKN